MLIVRFQPRFPSPFYFLLIYENLESLLTPSSFLASSSSCFLFSFIFAKKSLTSLSAVPSVSSSVLFGSGFFFASHFRFFFGGCIDLKDCARELVIMVAEVNWEGCHHRDRWSSLHPNCCMVLAERVSEKVVTMTSPEMIAEAREQVLTMTAPETIVEAREKVLMMTAPTPSGLSEIHHSRGL
jgi:hypothetical protein